MDWERGHAYRLLLNCWVSFLHAVAGWEGRRGCTSLLLAMPWLSREVMEQDISQQQHLSSSSSSIRWSSKEREKQRVENLSPKCKGLGKSVGRMLLPSRDSSLSYSVLE